MQTRESLVESLATKLVKVAENTDRRQVLNEILPMLFVSLKMRIASIRGETATFRLN